jgi:hypothetical protein
MAKLTTKKREKLSTKSFALKGRRYPIEDKAHARNALARVAQHGSAQEKAEVRRKVHAKFPDIGAVKTKSKPRAKRSKYKHSAMKGQDSR